MPRTSPASLALTLALALTLGCGGPVPRADLKAARDLVEASLQAWKDGQRGETLATRPEPIRFADDDWQRGMVLAGFEVLRVHGETDGSARCQVRLELRGARGQAVTREVTYQVVLRPAVVISRDPYF